MISIMKQQNWKLDTQKNSKKRGRKKERESAGMLDAKLVHCVS